MVVEGQEDREPELVKSGVVSLSVAEIDIFE